MSEEELHIKNISLVHRISAVNNMSAQPTWGYLDVSLQLPENLPEWDILPQVKKSTRRPVNLKQLLFCPTDLSLKCGLNLKHFVCVHTFFCLHKLHKSAAQFY